MTAPNGRPPDRRDTAAPRGKAEGGPGAEADTWRDIHEQDMAWVCPVYVLPDGQLLQCRTVEWTPARGRRLRADAAARMPPLASGHRDPDAPRSDAPDREYRRPVDWNLAAQLAGDPDEAAATG